MPFFNLTVIFFNKLGKRLYLPKLNTSSINLKIELLVMKNLPN